MKRYLPVKIAVIVGVIILTCAASILAVVIICQDTSNVPNIEEASLIKPYGKSSMVQLEDGLWYDSTTHIVYWWTGSFSGTFGEVGTIPTPYYAPNGLPYRYDPRTKSFEEISKGD